MHPVVKRARELLERRSQDEAEHTRWRAQHSEELLAAECDALLDRLKPIHRRDFSDDGIIRKVREDARVWPEQQQQQAQPQHGRQMSPELQEQWNIWCDSRIDAKVDEFNNIEIRRHVADINEEFAAGLEISKELKVELRELREEVKELRARADEQKARDTLFNPGEAVRKMRAEISTLRKQISSLRKKS